jgi:hypothetical protein
MRVDVRLARSFGSTFITPVELEELVGEGADVAPRVGAVGAVYNCLGSLDRWLCCHGQA